MKKIIERLIVFFIGLPALLSIVVFFPQYNHLCLNLATLVFAVLGAVEFRNILSHKNLNISLPETIILGGLSPAAWTAVVSFGVPEQIVPVVFFLGASWLLVSRIFTAKENLDFYINRSVGGFAVMIYPGFFMAWIVKMAAFPEAGMVILIYFLVAFLNDSIAWVAGVLFGKNNRGHVAASPSKSIAGFVGGLTASVITGIAAVVLIPGVFTSNVLPSIPAGALLGFCAGIAGTLGDLSESAIKRSVGVKDSGTLIMGRGGALDSIDSLALAAPIYFIIYGILF